MTWFFLGIYRYSLALSMDYANWFIFHHIWYLLGYCSCCSRQDLDLQQLWDKHGWILYCYYLWTARFCCLLEPDVSAIWHFLCLMKNYAHLVLSAELKGSLCYATFRPANSLFIMSAANLVLHLLIIELFGIWLNAMLHIFF